MLFTTYTDFARKTLKVLPFQHHLIHMTAGVSGEYGELIDGQKKVAIYGKAVDGVNRVEEVGDCFWYIACACEELAVHPIAIQTAIDTGLADGIKQREMLKDPFDVLGALTGLNLGVASCCSHILNAKAAGDQQAMNGLIALGNVMGVTCAALGVDPSMAMEANIEKLNKRRYKNGFSAEAALNRDLDNEQQGLQEAIVSSALGTVEEALAKPFTGNDKPTSTGN